MKLFSAFSNTFADKLQPLNTLYELAQAQESLNGLYLCTGNTVDTSFVGQKEAVVKTWYDLSGSTNYLYSSSTDSAPSFVSIDNNLNQNSSIAFNIDGTEQLLFKRPLSIKTIIIVYYSTDNRSYLIYSPINTPPPDPLYYDLFPSYTDTIWSTCSLSNNFAYNSTTRLNTQVKPSTTKLPLNYPRILTTHNLGGNSQTGVIQGIGGRIGQPNGGEAVQGITDSVKGNIAAILTFSDNLTNTVLLELELALRAVYINYTGSTVVGNKTFKYLLNDTVNFDFSGIVVDGWATPTTYEILYPFTLGLIFNGSILQGFLTTTYNDVLTIRITNSIGLQSTLSFKFEVVKSDPLIPSLPELNNLQLVLSSHKDSITNTTYGVYANEDNTIEKWEDARRVGSNLSTLVPNGQTIGSYDKTLALPEVKLSNGERLTSSNTLSMKSFLIVYLQNQYGNRYILDGLPDRRGTGVLLTTSSNTQIHGQTDVTRLAVSVNKVRVNTLLYKYELNKLGFIYGYQQDNVSIPIYGLDSSRGSVYFVCIWDKQLTTTQLNQAIQVISDRYISDQSPFIVNRDIEFRKIVNVEVDLSTKVVDLKNRVLSYNILINNYSATITNNILSFIATQDELLTFSIEVTNTDNFSSILTFDVDVTLRTNSLYLNIKEYFATRPVTPVIQDIYLATFDSLVFSASNIINQWKDYRLNGRNATALNLTTFTTPLLDDKLAVSYPLEGNGYIDFDNDITSSDFILVYVKPDIGNISMSFLGSNTTLLWSSSNDLVDAASSSSAVVFGDKFVNKQNVSNSYKLLSSVVNVLYLHTTNPITVSTLAKQMTTNNLSLKGTLPLFMTINRELTFDEFKDVDNIIRDYYDPLRFVLILHFNGNTIDSSTESTNLIGASSFTTSSKFGSQALRLLHSTGTSLLQIPNSNNISYLREYFSISCWLNISNALELNTVLNIYTQDGISIYIRGNTLVIARVLNSVDVLISYVLPTLLYSTQGSYFHLEVSRVINDDLVLFINGAVIGSVIDNYEYGDVSTNGIIGGLTGSNGTNSIVNLDEFVILKRGFLHETNFVVPGSEYIV